MAVYGGSIGQVAQNEMVLGAQQRAAAERQLMMLLEQQNRQRQYSRADSQDAEQRRQFDESMALRRTEGNLARTARAEEFEAMQDYRRDALRESERARRQNILLNRRRYADANVDRDARMFLPEAVASADEGAWGTEEEFLASNPASMVPYAKALVNRSLRARKALEMDLNASRSDADLLNQDAALEHMIGQERERSWDGSRWFGRADSDAIAGWEKERTTMSPAIAGVRGDRNRVGRLVPDATGRYRAGGSLPWQERMPVRDGQTPQSFSPAPTDPSMREVGQVYQTPRGPLRWTARGTWVTP